jgi:radical SAM superfamily enzyme YgiQ (UPF0313 family)
MATKKKVMLIQPGGLHEVTWFPHGLMAVSSALLEGGFESIIIDQRIDENWRDRISENINDCFVVGFTIMSGSPITHALLAAEYVKAIAPNVPILFGGYHASILPMQTIRHPLVDYVYIGAAGSDLIVFMNALLDRKRDLQKLSSIVAKGTNGTQPLSKMDLDVSIYRNWRASYGSILNPEGYRSHNNIASFFLTYSCPYDCAFCAIVNVHRFKMRNSEYIIDELKYLIEEKKYSKIAFLDGLLFAGQRTLRVFRQMADSGLSFEWRGNARADSFDSYSDDDIGWLANHGMKSLLFGFESGSDKILTILNKRHSVQQCIDVIKRYSNYDVDVHASMMTAIPGETVDDLKKSIDFLFKLKEVNKRTSFNMNTFIPVPGSKTYADMISSGWTPVEDRLECYGCNQSYSEKLQRSNLPWLSNKGFEEYCSLHDLYFGSENSMSKFGSNRGTWLKV